MHYRVHRVRLKADRVHHTQLASFVGEAVPECATVITPLPVVAPNPASTLVLADAGLVAFLPSSSPHKFSAHDEMRWDHHCLWPLPRTVTPGGLQYTYSEKSSRLSQCKMCSMSAARKIIGYATFSTGITVEQWLVVLWVIVGEGQQLSHLAYPNLWATKMQTSASCSCVVGGTRLA
jgi:hypothetical protein